MNKEIQQYYKITKNASSNSELWNIIVNLVKEKQESENDKKVLAAVNSSLKQELKV